MSYQGIQAGFVKPQSPLDWAEGVAFYRGDPRNLAISMQSRPKFLEDTPQGLKKPIVFDGTFGGIDDLGFIFSKKTYGAPVTLQQKLDPFAGMKKKLMIAGVAGVGILAVAVIVWKRRQQS